KAAVAANDANNAVRDASLAAPAAQFRPGSGTLGQALGSFVDPLSQAASPEAETRYQEALGRYQAANKDVLDVYKQLAALDPNEPGALLRYAQAAKAAADIKTAVALYTRFVKRFSDDPLAADARKKIKELKKQL